LADEYYRCIKESLTGSTTGSIKRCLKIARQYRNALTRQLEDLSRLSDPNFVEHERKVISDYLRLIDNDLNRLEHGEIDKLLAKRKRRKLDQ
jgi:hypothetical protein